jgi:hypothetical protein
MTLPSSSVTVTLDRDQWQALLDAVPATAMGYTPAGLLVFAAYQAISDALNPSKPQQAAS